MVKRLQEYGLTSVHQETWGPFGRGWNYTRFAGHMLKPAYAPLIGFQVQHRARLVAEYDVIRDAMAINSAGVPTDKKNNIFTVRLQGEL